jgi:hypothetical protein
MIMFLQSPLVHGVVSGVGAAVLVDLVAFLTWKSWDAARTFDYRLAVLRYLQGAVGGGLVAAGIKLGGLS